MRQKAAEGCYSVLCGLVAALTKAQERNDDAAIDTAFDAIYASARPRRD
jgi:hypothetical protein